MTDERRPTDLASIRRDVRRHRGAGCLIAVVAFAAYMGVGFVGLFVLDARSIAFGVAWAVTGIVLQLALPVWLLVRAARFRRGPRSVLWLRRFGVPIRRHYFLMRAIGLACTRTGNLLTLRDRRVGGSDMRGSIGFALAPLLAMSSSGWAVAGLQALTGEPVPLVAQFAILVVFGLVLYRLLRPEPVTFLEGDLTDACERLVARVGAERGGIGAWEVATASNEDWPEVVRALAERVDVVLLDVTEASDAIRYELRLLFDLDVASRAIFIYDTDVEGTGVPSRDLPRELVDELPAERLRALEAIPYDSWGGAAARRDLAERLHEAIRSMEPRRRSGGAPSEPEEPAAVSRDRAGAPDETAPRHPIRPLYSDRVLGFLGESDVEAIASCVEKVGDEFEIGPTELDLLAAGGSQDLIVRVEEAMGGLPRVRVAAEPMRASPSSVDAGRVDSS